MQKVSLFVILSLMFAFRLWAQDAVLTEQVGHNNHITATQFSPNGKFLASSSADNTLKLWDVKTKRLIRTFNGHTNAVRSLAFTPDGNFIVSASLDKTLILWEVSTGKRMQNYSKHTGGVNAVAVSKNGKLIASGSWDKTIIVWNTATADVVKILAGHSDGVNDLKFSPDGTKIASCSDDNSVIVWDLLTGNELYTFTDHSDAVKSIDFSTDGTKIISQGADNKIFVSNISNKTAIHELTAEESFNSLVCNSEGNFLSIYNGEKLNIWNVESANELSSLSTGLKNLTALSISPNQKLAAMASGNKLFIINYLQQNSVQEISGFSSVISSVDVSSDTKMLVNGNRDKTVRLWDIQSGRYLAIFSGHTEAVEMVKFSKDNQLIVSASQDKTIRMWDISDLTSPRADKVLQGHTEAVSCIDIRIDSKYIASGSADKTVKMWKTETGENVRNFTGHTSMVHSVSMSNDGLWLVSGSWDGEMIIWDINANKAKQRVKAHNGNVWTVKFSPDNRTIISGGADDLIKIWDANTGQLINTLSGHTDYVKSIDISPDGNTFASGSWDNKIITWNTRNGVQLQTLKGHNNYIRSVSFSADGKYLVSGSSDTQMKIWDLVAGTELLTIIPFTESEDYVVTTPAGFFDGTDFGIKKALHYVKGLEVIPLEAFFEQKFTPNLWARVIAGEDFTTDRPNDFKLPPEVRITSPKSDFVPSTPEVTITIEATDRGGGIDEVRLYQNNKLVASTERGFKPINADKNTKTVSFDVQLVAGMNQFTAVAFNSERTESSPDVLVINYAADSWATNLYIIAVGINQYRNSMYNLNYAVSDAEAFVKSLKKGTRKIYRKTDVQFITNQEATKENIAAAFNKVKQKAEAKDVFMFFYAGHGVMSEGDDNSKGEYYFVPHDVTQMYGNDMALSDKGISSTELMQWSKEILAQKQMILIDACQSGGAVEALAQRGVAEQKALIQLARSTGTAIIASSGTQQVASEFQQLGHGVFTYSLLEAMDGKADGGKMDKIINISELKAYLDERVPELTQQYRGQAQYPTGYVKGQEFPVVVVE